MSGWLALIVSAVTAVAFGIGIAYLEDWIRDH